MLSVLMMIIQKKKKSTCFLHCIKKNMTYKDHTVEEDHKYFQDPFASHLESVFFKLSWKPRINWTNCLLFKACTANPTVKGSERLQLFWKCMLCVKCSAFAQPRKADMWRALVPLNSSFPVWFQEKFIISMNTTCNTM